MQKCFLYSTKFHEVLSSTSKITCKFAKQCLIQKLTYKYIILDILKIFVLESTVKSFFNRPLPLPT